MIDGTAAAQRSRPRQMTEDETMLRIIRSLIPGLLIGTAVGLFLGWAQFPASGRHSALSDLAQPYRDDYLVMIAAGYAVDADLAGAAQRLSRLYSDLAGPELSNSIERIITTSTRDLDDIQLLVELARDLGQLTAIMRPFLAPEERRP